MSKNAAAAKLSGSEKYPEIYGTVTFKQTEEGVKVNAMVFNLPQNNECSGGVFGFHIHEGKSCSGNEKDPFADAKGHYNPKACSHPYHAGDLPPLFSNSGCAKMTVITDRFKLEEIIGRAVIVHSMPDDFTSQPAGNSGEKIACGIISIE